MEPRKLFDKDDYSPWQEGPSGANKLHSSAVAPLVASARGYVTVIPETLKQHIDDARVGSMTTREGRQYAKVVRETTSALLMPWFRMDHVVDGWSQGNTIIPTTVQMRPAAPYSPPGKPSMKYIQHTGARAVIDMHPSTPASWWKTAPKILFVEGLLKGDAALTALLRDAGIDDAKLADATVTDPRQTLHDLMETVPVENRALVLSFFGVGTWHRLEEWTSLNINDRDEYIAFDGDMRTNVNVWSQADQLVRFLVGRSSKSSTGSVRIVDMNMVTPEAANKKLGIDDFLAAHGTLSDIIGDGSPCLVDMPECPDREDAGVGRRRIGKDGTVLEELSYTFDDDKNPTGTTWKEIYPFGGRVLKIETTRRPSDDDIKTGKITPPSKEDSTMVDLLVQWADPDTKDVHEAVVSGSEEILNTPPKDWKFVKNVYVPTELRLAPAWPPREQKIGEAWIDTVKAHRRDEIRYVTRWEGMGYLPTSAGAMAFVAGDTIIPSPGYDPDPSMIGVTEKVVSGASGFGAIPPRNTDNWKAEAKALLEDILEFYIQSGAWTERDVAATILALGLRPAVPLVSRTVSFFVGPPGKGKSFSASMAMSFWQARPGTWSESRLPGSAKDTLYSTEIAVSTTPIWVADDLAPSADRMQANREESSISDLIRNVHNHTGKLRRFADGSARPQYLPRAVLIVTAENSPSIASVTDRAVEVWFGPGTLSPSNAPTDMLRRIRDESGIASRLAWVFVYWHLLMAQETGWSDFVKEIEEQKQDCIATAERVITDVRRGDTFRHATMAGDLMITIERLRQFAKYVGADAKYIKLLGANELQADVASQVAATHEAQKELKPGRSLLSAIYSVLASGRGHLTSIETPGAAPFDTRGIEDAAQYNELAGWRPNGGKGLSPSGTAIGHVIYSKSGRPVALLDLATAFKAAQEYPEKVPAGSKSRSAWSSVWAEGLAVPQSDGWSRSDSGKGRVNNTIRYHHSSLQYRGVPVYLDQLESVAFASDDDNSGQGAAA